MQDFKDLEVWKKAHQLTLKIYKNSMKFPDEELYGLTSQIRRASVSIPTNIAEGRGRGSDPDFARFLRIAMGSANELEYLLILTNDLKILNENNSRQLLNSLTEVKRMLNTFIKKLKAKG
jgi:four helix bundle protein